MEYLLSKSVKSKSNRIAHIWLGLDTACNITKVFKHLKGFQVAEHHRGKKICGYCLKNINKGSCE